MSCRSIRVETLEEWRQSSGWLKERSKTGGDVEGQVREILAQVESRGDEALIEYTRKFDCENFSAPLRISEQQQARAAASVPAKDRDQIYKAADNIRAFHESQKDKSWFVTRPDGTILG